MNNTNTNMYLFKMCYCFYTKGQYMYYFEQIIVQWSILKEGRLLRLKLISVWMNQVNGLNNVILNGSEYYF